MATVCECYRADLLANSNNNNNNSNNNIKTDRSLRGFGVVKFVSESKNQNQSGNKMMMLPLVTMATTIAKNNNNSKQSDYDDSNVGSENYNSNNALNQITVISSKINLSNSLTSSNSESILRMQILEVNGSGNKPTISENQKDSDNRATSLGASEQSPSKQQQQQEQEPDLPAGCNQRQQLPDSNIRPSSKRYFILFMFVLLQMVKSFQWICMASVTNVVAKFYDVDNLAINWTALLFMVTFLILALPVSWIMDSLGLRRSLLIGSIGVTIGVCIKCFSCHRDGFMLSMFGHLIIGLAEPFFFSSYSQVASIWFPDHQVALATAASLIGEQTGLALGFIIPPLMIGSDPSDFDTIQEGLSRLFLFVAIISIVNTSCIVLFFDDKPRFAPGIARFKQIQEATSRRQSKQAQAIATKTYNTVGLIDTKPVVAAAATATTGHHRSSLDGDNGALMERRRRFSRRVSQSLSEQVKLSRKFVTSKHFILLLMGFGLNVGVAYSIHTLLNQMIIRPSHSAGLADILHAMPADEADISMNNSASATGVAPLLPRWNDEDANLIVGNAGLILIMSGLIGSGLCGFVLDRYHNYKLTTASAYLLTLISMAALTVCLLLENEIVLYLVCIPLGFALTGYASCGFDYGVEITYPKPELLSSTLLNISAQIFGIPISLLGSMIVDEYGSQALGAFFCAMLLLGFIITLLQGGQLRRQDAVREGELQQQRQKQLAEQLKRLQQRQQQPVWSI